MELLRSLGLSSGESKLYLRLLSQPEGEMLDKVVTGFGIPAAIAEDSLKSLADKGLVRISSNRVEVVQPRTVLQRILDERKRSLDSQVAKETSVALELEKILEPVYWESRLGIRPEEIIEPFEIFPRWSCVPLGSWATPPKRRTFLRRHLDGMAKFASHYSRRMTVALA